MNMKKKRRVRFLSFLFGLMIFSMPILFAGCGGKEAPSLGGVKVLSRPTDYSFKEAVGEFSENYYNIFAKHILENLYNIYEYDNLDLDVLSDRKIIFDQETDETRKKGFLPLDASNGKTYTTNDLGDDKYYLYETSENKQRDKKKIHNNIC